MKLLLVWVVKVESLGSCLPLAGKVFYGNGFFFFAQKTIYKWDNEIVKSLVASVSTWSQGVHLVSPGRRGSMWSYQFFTTQGIGMAT